MNENNRFLSFNTVLVVLVLVFILAFATAPQSLKVNIIDTKTSREEKPPAETKLPVRWGDLGAKLVAAGVIDGEKFEQLYASRVRNELAAEIKSLLYGRDNGRLKITADNAGVILNLLWALG